MSDKNQEFYPFVRDVRHPVEQAELIIKMSYRYADGEIIPKGVKCVACLACGSRYRLRREAIDCATRCLAKSKDSGGYKEDYPEGGPEPWQT